MSTTVIAVSIMSIDGFFSEMVIQLEYNFTEENEDFSWKLRTCHCVKEIFFFL